MPDYKSIDSNTVEGRRTAEKLRVLRLELENAIPAKTVDPTLLLATWNIREFGGTKSGGREAEPHRPNTSSGAPIRCPTIYRSGLSYTWTSELPISREKWQYLPPKDVETISNCRMRYQNHDLHCGLLPILWALRRL